MVFSISYEIDTCPQKGFCGIYLSESSLKELRKKLNFFHKGKNVCCCVVFSLYY